MADHLALYSRNCKFCKSLDPDEKKYFPKCHFEKGNKDCPASEIQIAVVGQAQRAAKAVLKARAANNIDQEIQILSFVAKKSKPFQQKFREWLLK